jgi:hypothetical protein
MCDAHVTRYFSMRVTADCACCCCFCCCCGDDVAVRQYSSQHLLLLLQQLMLQAHQMLHAMRNASPLQLIILTC